jgi:hypothetical protein
MQAQQKTMLINKITLSAGVNRERTSPVLPRLAEKD